MSDSLTEENIQDLILALSYGMSWFTQEHFEKVLKWAKVARKKDCPLLQRILFGDMAITVLENGDMRFSRRPDLPK